MKALFSISIVSFVLSVAAASAVDVLLTERIAVFGSSAGLQYSLNPGIAWGIRLPAGIQEVLIGIALLCVLYLAIQNEKSLKFSIFHFPFSTSQAAYGMILGGGAANIVDRLRDGYVTDYFQIGSFPIFNVADSFVTIGVAVLLIDTLRKERSE